MYNIDQIILGTKMLNINNNTRMLPLLKLCKFKEVWHLLCKNKINKLQCLIKYYKSIMKQN